MTDPKSISQHREHYTDQYGVEPLNRNQSTNGTYESGLGDTVDLDGNVIPDGYQEFFSDFGGEMPADVLDDFSEQEIQQAMQGGAEPIQWDEATQTQNQLIELVAKLKESRTKEILGEDAAATFLSRANELKKQFKDAANLPPEAKDGLIEQAQSLLDDSAVALDEAEGNQRERVESAERSAKALLDKIEDSDLPKAKQDELKEKVEDFLDDLAKIKAGKGVLGEDQVEELEELGEEVSRAVGTEALIEDFENLPAKIPNKGGAYEGTVNLVREVRDALKDGDWSQVHAYLDEALALPPMVAHVLNDMVQQFVGSLYFGAAGEDESKLNQLLSLIPREVRQKLADIAMLSEGERLHMGGCANDAERREHYFYGNPTITADRLLSDNIEESMEDIGRSATGTETGSEG